MQRIGLVTQGSSVVIGLLLPRPFPQMASYHATPHQYWTALQVRDWRTFANAYDDQIAPADLLTLRRPSEETLRRWAKSCFGLCEYKGIHLCGGWSPFRSGEIGVVREGFGSTSFFHKLGDQNEWEFLTASSPGKVDVELWLETVRAFVRTALRVYIAEADPVCVISPARVVQKMLHREFGGCGDTFSRVLVARGFEPAQLDAMIREVWGRMLQLPAPAVFGFVTQDDEAQSAVVALVTRCGESSQPKGLRV